MYNCGSHWSKLGVLMISRPHTYHSCKQEASQTKQLSCFYFGVDFGKTQISFSFRGKNWQTDWQVAAQSEALEWNKRCPWIVAAASKRGTRTCVRMISDNCHWLFVLYKSFQRLTAGLTYYWQRLATVTISLIHTLSSCRWCLQAFQRNKRRLRIVAAQTEQRNM